MITLFFFACNEEKEDFIKKENRTLQKRKGFDSVTLKELDLKWNLWSKYNTLTYSNKNINKNEVIVIFKQLDSLIKFSKNKIIFYQLKIGFYDNEKKYEQIIELLDSIKLLDLKVNKSIFDDFKIKAYIKANDMKSAKLLYYQLDQIDAKLIQQYPDSVEIQGAKLYRQLLFEDKKQIVAKFEKLIQKYPNNITLISYEPLIRDFDKVKAYKSIDWF